MKNYKYTICAIGAEVNNIEQRQILSGIIEESKKNSIELIVLSNLYNYLQPEKSDSADNKIYEMLSVIKADGFIILSESFVNPKIRVKIHDLLIKRTQIPIILAGTELPEFSPKYFSYVNTSDQKDMETVTDKLIEENHFTRIALLTGPLSLEPSRNRRDGYRKSLEKHGIPYDENLVYEGDFWYTSGERLAKRYILGELPCPQALVCANDYMAFGVLDAFAEAEIDITEHMALMGYEYIPERSLHKPLLTTFQRNRHSLGISAVNNLICRIEGKGEPLFEPPCGNIIAGQSCPCGFSSDTKLQEELVFMRTVSQYTYWNLKSDMASRLTECKNYDEFISAMGEELFIVRYAKDVVLCLFENWFVEAEKQSSTIICRNANKYARRGDIVLDVSELHTLAEHFPDMAVFYFNPVFFKDHLLGYCAVMYDQPDTYDDTYRQWLKSVSNGLEFLRLKTDINFLLQCSTLSSSYDGLTGLFNAEGIRTAFQLMKNSDKPDAITAISFRLVCNKDVFTSEENSKDMIGSLVATAETVRRFCGNSGIAGRISDFELMLIYPTDELNAELLAEAVYSEILFSKPKRKINGSLLFCGKKFCGDDVNFGSITDSIGKCLRQNEYETKKNSPYFKELEKLHRETELFPLQRYSLDEAGRSLNLNPNYFNRIYKQIYGISFYQSQICSLIRFAKHLLTSTDCSVAEIAEKCGYIDSKYFIRQFTSVTSLSPAKYRIAVRRFFQ